VGWRKFFTSAISAPPAMHINHTASALSKELYTSGAISFMVSYCHRGKIRNGSYNCGAKMKIAAYMTPVMASGYFKNAKA